MPAQLTWIFIRPKSGQLIGIFNRPKSGQRIEILGGLILGDPPLFPRHSEVELQWRILDPILERWEKRGQPEQYHSGGWGPESAYEMMARDGRMWRRP